MKSPEEGNSYLIVSAVLSSQQCTCLDGYNVFFPLMGLRVDLGQDLVAGLDD